MNSMKVALVDAIGGGATRYMQSQMTTAAIRERTVTPREAAGWWTGFYKAALDGLEIEHPSAGSQVVDDDNDCDGESA